VALILIRAVVTPRSAQTETLQPHETTPGLEAACHSSEESDLQGVTLMTK
jgi:hypothetical protein